MSRYLTLANQNSIRFGERKKGASKIQPANTRGMGLVYAVIVMVCAVSVFYIYMVNNLATKGFEIKGLETRLDELKKANELKNIKAAELKSMYNIEERTKDLDMVAPKDVSYLNLPGNVAMK